MRLIRNEKGVIRQRLDLQFKKPMQVLGEEMKVMKYAQTFRGLLMVKREKWLYEK